MKLKLILLVSYFSLNYSFAADYFISNDGNNIANGTSASSPWQTLDRLNTALANGTIVQNDRIFFRKGDTFRGTIIFTNNDRITFDSYGTGDLPVIKGSEIITGWTVHSGSIWKATVTPRVYFVYANNVVQTLARTPNTGTFNLSSATDTSITSTAIGISGLNFVGANLCLREYDWQLSRQIVSSQTGNTVSWSTAINAAYTNANFYFDNKLSLLDTNNEWYYDTATTTLYLQSSVNPNTLTIEATTQLKGIAGNNNKSNNIIRNLQFEHYADAAIDLPGTTNSNQINNNVFKNNYTAIFVGGNNTATIPQGALINNNTFDSNYGEAIFMANTANSNINNNTVLNTGLDFGKHRPNFQGSFYSTGIRITNAKAGTTIANNNITNCGNNGIRFNGPGVIVEKNYLENTLLNMSDGGAIYTVGAESINGIIRQNFVKNVPGDLNGIPGGIANGIYIDNNVSNFNINTNTVEDVIGGSGILINAEAYNHTITNNTTYKCKEGITFSDWGSGLSVYGNTVLNNVLYANISEGVPILVLSNDNNYNVFTNSNDNFLVNPYNTKVVERKWSVPAVYNLSQWQTLSGFDTNSIGSFYNWTFPTDDSFIVKNLTSNPITTTYTNTVDLNNNPVTSLTLPAYTSKILISNVLSLSRNINEIENFISIFPNPSLGKFHIKMLSDVWDQDAKIQVYSLDGKLILDKKLDANSNEININQKGIYILKVFIKDKNYHKKIIVN